MNLDVVWVELGPGKAKHEALRSFLFSFFFLALARLTLPGDTAPEGWDRELSETRSGVTTALWSRGLEEVAL